MLVGLSIRNVVLIEALDLEFGPGLWALTGETGAGKSILLDALGLATGARAERSLVRQGAKEAAAAAAFSLPRGHPVWAGLSADGLGEGPELILRRTLAADGRSRAFVNDQPVGIAKLREIGESLLEVHGQHDDRLLLNSSVHREFLDAFAGLTRDAAAVALAYEAMRGARARLEAERGADRASREAEEYVRHALAELVELKPQENEEERLALERAAMMNAEKIADDLREAHGALAGEDGFDRRLGAALRRLERARDKAPGVLDAVLAALDRALGEANEARAGLERAMSALDVDGTKLEAVEERLFALRAAARKYRVEVARLPAVIDDLAGRLRRLESRKGALEALERAAREAEVGYFDAALALSDKRAKAARRLDKAVTGELAPLKLDKAIFRVEVERLDADKAGPHGLDRVSYRIATNPGAPLGPLTEIASGGELARFVLALRVALLKRGTAATTIFDEVDRGVGGAVADAVGERLARLAQEGQVLVVTHSPQVAARAEHHLRVEKETVGKKTTTRVTRLDAGTRREEIARMLSAARVTEEARAAAARLLGQSKSLRKTGTTG